MIRQLTIACLAWREKRLFAACVAAKAHSYRELRLYEAWRKAARKLRELVQYAR